MRAMGQALYPPTPQSVWLELRGSLVAVICGEVLNPLLRNTQLALAPLYRDCRLPPLTAGPSNKASSTR